MCELVERLAAAPLEERTVALAWDREAPPWDETHRPAQSSTETKMPSDQVGRVGIDPRPRDYEAIYQGKRGNSTHK